MKRDPFMAVYGWLVATLNFITYANSGYPANLAIGSVVAFIALLYTFGMPRQ